jgi:hypothetical protein
MIIAAVGWKTNGDEADRYDGSGRPEVAYAATLGIQEKASESEYRSSRSTS